MPYVFFDWWWNCTFNGDCTDECELQADARSVQPARVTQARCAPGVVVANGSFALRVVTDRRSPRVGL